MRWYTDSRACPHYNENACPTCDFDGYYADNYPDCPWRERRQSDGLAYEAPTGQ